MHKNYNCVTPSVPQQVPKLLQQIYFPDGEQQDQVTHFVFPVRLPLLKNKPLYICDVLLYTVAVLFLLSQQLVHGQLSSVLLVNICYKNWELIR